jgi:hypothetical protein
MRERMDRVVLNLAFVPWILAAALQPVASPSTLEYEVKAAYLLNFVGFAEWPAAAFSAPDAPITVCLAAQDPFGTTIERVFEGEQVRGRRIIVERMRTLQNADRCTMLFVPAGVGPAPWLGRAGPHTLTVGESSGFIGRGGVIELVVDAGRVRFDVNVAAAESREIRLSSRLLRVARTAIQ